MTRRLIDGCDAILADLDGVVYAGPGAISEAPESLERAKSEGVPVMFVTNNASRAVETVAEHLSELVGALVALVYTRTRRRDQRVWQIVLLAAIAVLLLVIVFVVPPILITA